MLNSVLGGFYKNKQNNAARDQRVWLHLWVTMVSHIVTVTVATDIKDRNKSCHLVRSLSWDESPSYYSNIVLIIHCVKHL